MDNKSIKQMIEIINAKLKEVSEDTFCGMGKYEYMEFELKKESKIEVLEEVLNELEEKLFNWDEFLKSNGVIAVYCESENDINSFLDNAYYKKLKWCNGQNIKYCEFNKKQGHIYFYCYDELTLTWEKHNDDAQVIYDWKNKEILSK